MVIAVLIWQLVVWSGSKPQYSLPPPGEVWDVLRSRIADGSIPQAAWITTRLLFATMIAIIVIGIVVDTVVLVFGEIERTIRRRRGLLES